MPVDRHAGHKLLIWEGLLSWVPWLGQYWYLRRARVEYLRQLITEYRGLCKRTDAEPNDLTEQEKSEVEGIINIVETEPGQARWDDVYVLQQVLMRAYPDSRVHRSLWYLRAAFRDIAGPVAYADYLASNPPNPLDEKVTSGQLRADAEQLLSALQWYQTMRSVVERERNHLARRLATLTVLLCVIGGVVLYLMGRDNPTGTTAQAIPPMHVLLGVIFAGALGGLVSTQQRLHGIPVSRNPTTRILTLSQSWYAVYYSPIMGALGAVILTILFTSGMIEGSLFPKFLPKGATAGVVMLDLAHIAVGTTQELAKVLVWSFLAGFSERLVPDTLDRLANRGSTFRSEAGTAK